MPDGVGATGESRSAGVGQFSITGAGQMSIVKRVWLRISHFCLRTSRGLLTADGEALAHGHLIEFPLISVTSHHKA